MTAQQYAARVAVTLHQAMPARAAKPLAQAAADRILANRSSDPSPDRCRWESRSPAALIGEALEETPDAAAWLVAAFDKAAAVGAEMDTEELAEALRYLAAAHAAMGRLRDSVAMRGAA